LAKPAVARYQISRQTRAGIYTADFDTDSADEAVEAFMRQMPAFEGGEMHLLDREELRKVALVKWKTDTTEIGLPVSLCQNVFHDWHLALIACAIQTQETVRDAVELLV
jgi:hypothetical protein